MTQTETRAADEAIRPLRLHDRKPTPDRLNLQVISEVLAKALAEANECQAKADAMPLGWDRDIEQACGFIFLRSTVAACVSLLQRECGL